MTVAGVAGIIFIAIGAVFLTAGGICLAAAVLFAKFPGEVGRSPGSLKKTKHKKNVTVWGRFPSKPIHVKDLTKATYHYNAGGKTYKLRASHYFTRPKQVNYMVTVVYLKRFPRIAYKTDELGIDDNHFGLCAFVCLAIAVMWLAGGICLIMG